ncbi:uncharacterized protein AB675_11782 [Cyphellophora attinorum]|uniref:F-box domain-containing protein n=1 Tax=Cyphellophora attinorum TaxID=1664694 RepID=A0A0N1HJV1_9EURO|nr:uncharacterized protein AB675_11782 [Phialophora attinorum]KPI36872.1 hypothetical protein AB675_11782 [Phialophora attinorum]
MSQVVSAPPWEKPGPTLAGMPLEILEKIIGFAIPESVIVEATYRSEFSSRSRSTVYVQDEAFQWFQSSDFGDRRKVWDSEFLLLSKRIRTAALRALSTRIKYHCFRRFSFHGSNYRLPAFDSVVRRKSIDHFENMFTNAAG